MTRAVAAVVLLAAIVGAVRLNAIDHGAYDGVPGQVVTVRGSVIAPPRRTQGAVRVRIATPAGRLAVEAPEPVPDLPVGRELAARGVLREPPPWLVPSLRRHGVRLVLDAERVALTGRRRGGLSGALDRVRDRAEDALGQGAPEPAAALARGMVLGQDERIDAGTIDDFKRSGLAHLLAVSGQNVILLAALALPLLALAGLGMRARLLGVLALIAVYVPVTGAGPSIQRAGVMGAAGIVATLAGRPRVRWYAVFLAAAVTLAVNPLAVGDVGWQLSFAAVIGILLWARPIAGALANRLGASPAKRALAEGFGMTVAATLVTAPLMAHHFETVSLASLPANLLALPAVAPAMWLGMLTAALAQIPSLPLTPLLGALAAVESLLVGYVAWVAHLCAVPGWALVDLKITTPWAVACAYALMLAVGWSLPRWFTRRFFRGRRGDPCLSCARAAGEHAQEGSPRDRTRGHALGPLLAAALCVATLALLLPGPGKPGADPAIPQAPQGKPELTIRALDVGQGDAILLDPADADPILVDGGPPEANVARQLERLGVRRLAAAIATHPQRDHDGGIVALLGRFPIGTLVYGEPSRQLLGAAAAAGVPARQVAEGDVLRAGRLRLDVLWPPPNTPAAEDPNLTCLVLLARWGGFRALLTGDAEAESVPVDPGPVDLLKVAHHGSRDAGLPTLLDHTSPRLALISVGSGNDYGHPTPQTTATLASHRIPTLRTDQEGAIEIEVRGKSWGVVSR